MEAAALFNGLIDELDRVVADPDELKLVLCAAPLRVLLVDGNPLYDQVRRARRAQGLPELVAHFEVFTNPAYERVVLEDDPIFWSRGDALSPRLGSGGGRGGQVERLNKGQFLKQTVVYLQGHRVSVRELIKQVGYVGGVLHAGSPSSEVQEKLLYLDETHYVGNLPVVLQALRAVADIVAHGLRPLIIE